MKVDGVICMQVTINNNEGKMMKVLISAAGISKEHSLSTAEIFSTFNCLSYFPPFTLIFKYILQKMICFSYIFIVSQNNNDYI